MNEKPLDRLLQGVRKRGLAALISFYNDKSTEMVECSATKMVLGCFLEQSWLLITFSCAHGHLFHIILMQIHSALTPSPHTLSMVI